MMNKKDIPRLNGTLRSHSLQIPENIWKAKGIVVLGRRIKSVIFTTDLAIIRNCNADAVLAVYPFTPQQIISQTIVNASSIPVFAGVGGGTTTGLRSVLIARDAEAHGAFGVVVNAPTHQVVREIRKKFPTIPIIATGGPTEASIAETIEAGANTISYTPPSTADIFASMMENYRNSPDDASKEGSNLETIEKELKASMDII